MCLTVKRGTSKRKAKADILVYKCLKNIYGEGDYCTPYKSFPIYFEDGKCVMKIKHFSYSYSYYFLVSGFITDIVIKEGIHSYYNKKNASVMQEMYFYCGVKYYYAIIPKGAKYYIGKGGDIVSTELIIFKTEEDYKKYVKSSEKVCIIKKDSLSLQEI